jgi:hypothetical protein
MTVAVMSLSMCRNDIEVHTRSPAASSYYVCLNLEDERKPAYVDLDASCRRVRAQKELVLGLCGVLVRYVRHARLRQ